MLTIEKWAIYTNAGVFVAISSFYTRLCTNLLLFCVVFMVLKLLALQ